MKRFWWMLACPLLVAALVSPSLAQDEEKPKKPAAKADEKKEPAEEKADEELTPEVLDKVSYLLGQNQGREFKQLGVEINPKALAEGLAAGLAGDKAKYTDDELKAAFTILQKQLPLIRAKRQKEIGDANAKKGKEFLATNGKREGVTTTKSGLQYEVIKKGDGKVSPKKSDTVVTHYHGTLVDGTVFDSSVQRKEPATFGVGQVIKGWTEALQLMKTGDKWKLYVPSELAYGAEARGNVIGPNSVLVFEVELISIEEPDDK